MPREKIFMRVQRHCFNYIFGMWLAKYPEAEIGGKEGKVLKREWQNLPSCDFVRPRISWPSCSLYMKNYRVLNRPMTLYVRIYSVSDISPSEKGFNIHRGVTL